MFDFIIIGSGPAGVIAGRNLLSFGYKVCMIDAGVKPKEISYLPDPIHFFEAKDNKAPVFYAPEEDFLSSQGGNAQITNARSHVFQYVENLLPISSLNFSPTQTLAQGGLSCSWGAACFTYDDEDLKKTSLPNLREAYENISDYIGISGPKESRLCRLKNKQPSSIIDHNGQSLFRHVKRSKSFDLEEPSLALLTEPLNGRKENPYFDMDFYANFEDSVFRADVALKDLKKNPNFSLIENLLAIQFMEQENSAQVHCKHIETKETKVLQAKKLIIAAGALNSYRFVANSLSIFDKPNPLLCNRYVYIPTLHLPNLGKKGSYYRHSLSQAFGEMITPQNQKLTLQFYSYRSLLISRLMAQTPMPEFFARIFWRALVESLIITGIHYPDDGLSPRSIMAQKDDLLPTLSIDFPFSGSLELAFVLKQLLKLKSLPLGIVKTKMGGSIHYAGTLPFNRPDLPLFLDDCGRLNATRHVYVVDSSGWTYLPSRGLTLTVMAASHHLTTKIHEKSTG